MLPEPKADGSETRNLGFGTPQGAWRRNDASGSPWARAR
jgi:hypothetical protein